MFLGIILFWSAAVNESLGVIAEHTLASQDTYNSIINLEVPYRVSNLWGREKGDPSGSAGVTIARPGV